VHLLEVPPPPKGLGNALQKSRIPPHKAYVWGLLNHFPLPTQYRDRFSTLFAGEQVHFLHPIDEQEDGGNYIMWSFITCSLQQILLGWLHRGGWDGKGGSIKGIKNRYNTLIGKHERKTTSISKYRWKGNIKIGLKEQGTRMVTGVNRSRHRLFLKRYWTI
jgi:hypothetical protein